MKYLSNINRIHICWNRFWIKHAVSNIFLCYFFSCGQQLKITKLATREKLNPHEKILNPQNTHEKKFWTHEYPLENISDPVIFTIKNLGPTKYPQRRDGTIALDPRDSQWHTTHEISSYI